MSITYPPTSKVDTSQEGYDGWDPEKEEVAGIRAGLSMLGSGLYKMGQSIETRAMAFNYEMQASAARVDARSALFVGQQRENVVRKQASRTKGMQLAAQSASGFVAGYGGAAKQIETTQFEYAQTIADIQLSTADAVNKLEFEAEMADINSRLNKKIASIQKSTGIANAVVGLALAGASAYNGGSGSGGDS